MEKTPEYPKITRSAEKLVKFVLESLRENTTPLTNKVGFDIKIDEELNRLKENKQ